MNNFVTKGLLAEDYILKRLVYVNSANHGYSEILLDRHLAMFGGNNVGKTASLAGTKLLLYPEVNFSRCEKKFKFVGNRGTFSQEDSYDFYFPDLTSFIILEVQNPEGSFCMLLYKTNNYTYSRLFVPLSFDEMRHLFWDVDKDDFNDDLSVKTVKQFVIENDGLQTSDAAEIRSLMFEGMRGTKKQRRFCILPMKDARLDSIEAFRNIYQLAFDIKSSETDTLPKAIATLLEMGRGRDEERLSADLLDLATDYEELFAKQAQLQTLKNAEPIFNRVSSNFEQLTNSYKHYTLIHKSLRHLLNEAKESFDERYVSMQNLTDEASKQQFTTREEVEKANEASIKAKSQVEYLEEQLTLQSKRVAEVKNLYTSLGFSSVENTLEHLDHEYRCVDSLLRELRKEDGVKRQLQKELTKKKQLLGSKKELQNIIEDQSRTVASQLNNSTSASILYSLNQNIAKTIVPLTESHRDAVVNFTSLFDSDHAGLLTFLDKPIKGVNFKEINPERMVEEATLELVRVEQQLEIVEQNITEQGRALKNNDIESLITNTEQTLQKVEIQRDNIRALSELIRAEDDTSKKLKDKRDMYIKANISFEKGRNKLQEHTATANQCQNKLDTLKDESARLKRYESVFNTIQRHADIDFLFEEISDEVVLNDSWFEKLYKLSTDLSSLKTSVIRELHLLSGQVQIEGVDPHKQFDSVTAISKAVDSYAGEYATLQYDLIQLNTSICTHNQFVSNQIKELKTSKQFLSNFIKEINDELNSKLVSNLSEINLRPEINVRFESLLSTLDKQDISDETLLEPEFYQALTQFADSYFDKRTRKLKMHDIIHAVHYEYTLEETGERFTKSQSGGTTSTITAFVLSVLLKKITPDYVSLKMPIIVDEVGTLDFKNTKATIQQISEHGFSIFCATPTFSGFVSKNVGRWIMIDRAKIKKPRVPKCHMHILPEYIESFGSQSNEA
ncbi:MULTISPECIES: hypothetical protein [Aliiglaciecola]|uniref:hypothetical protein n=1 Tax=Aliiglaciecola TaxID=1406885 RepID=UPI001C08E23A|nr:MULTISPECIES: hypothetical protein [Aliiglaciecola]MBU2878739.1 hypothetical protein [Aliiglaciecola lipolytica]MDO6711364.1 hypothetical protein [Aliiglaciecola sp. 2_MG-2023]MDO6752187.1 hypothetical protein [Aliiglaciecola sp. 1_MG-2023]